MPDKPVGLIPRIMFPEFVQFLAFFLITVAFLKITSAYLINRNPGSSLGNGLGWFVPGLA